MDYGKLTTDHFGITTQLEPAAFAVILAHSFTSLADSDEAARVVCLPDWLKSTSDHGEKLSLHFTSVAQQSNRIQQQHQSSFDYC